jgi:hypothetical protein
MEHTPAEEPAPLAVGEPELVPKEEVRVSETKEGPHSEGPQGSIPQTAEKKRGRQKMAVKCKKVISRKKAGEQT